MIFPSSDPSFTKNYFISEENFLMRPTINNNNRRVIDVVVVVEIEEK